ncbi:MAG: Spy/CpxP family protein refolding chaperone [Candidatus Obscuribacterales bacterium]|nr:Spy/CpxP family protein refolding chaperone [Candidatus Obscuribacterales bacterium]
MKLNARKAVKPALLIGACLTLGYTAAINIEPAWAGKDLIAPIMDEDLKLALIAHFEKRFFNLIDATEEQKTKINALFSDQLEFARPLRAQMRKEAMDLADILPQDSLSEEQLREKIESIRALKEKIADKRLDTVLAVNGLLNKEQRQAISSKMKSRLTGNF